MSRLSQFVEKWLAGEFELAPITALLGVRPVSLGEGEARIELTAGERLHNGLARSTAASSATSPTWRWAPRSPPSPPTARPFTTLQLQMSYFLPVVDDRLSAHARVVRRGRGTAHLECDLEDGESRLVARATSVYAPAAGGVSEFQIKESKLVTSLLDVRSSQIAPTGAAGDSSQFASELRRE